MPESGAGLLVLVDGSSYLYRAFHAMPDLRNSRHEPTGAVYGVVNMLRRLRDQYPSDNLAVVFDAPGKTFRDDLYAEYKANRSAMPDELAAQIPLVHEAVMASGLPLLMEAGVEADDVIGTLAHQAATAGRDVLIVTGDKDFAQLVNTHIRLYDPMKEVVLDAQGVRDKFGVPPERIVDYLALMGDTVDNVPGVAKVGPKTAARWISEYGSLDGVMANAADVPGKVGENLREALAHLPLSRTLVTIARDVPLAHTMGDLHVREPDRSQLRSLFERLEFKSWLADLLGAKREAAAQTRDLTTNPLASDPGVAHAAGPVYAYETVFDSGHLSAWIERLSASDLFAFDTETTSLNVLDAEVVGVSFALPSGEAAYVPLAHRDPDAPAQLDRAAVLARLAPLLESETPRIVGQNLKYDLNVLARAGVSLRAIAHDTMLESYVLDSVSTRHDMDSLALKHLGRKTITYDEITGTGKSRIGFEEVRIEDASRYAAEDAEITMALHVRLWPALTATPALAAIYREMEMPLVPVIARMERIGVRIDAAALRRQSGELGARLVEIEREAHHLAGQPFNLGSPVQIQQILYDKLGLPVLRKTPKGQPSTAEDVLEELSLDYPLPRVILEHRSTAKLKSTYTDKLPEMVHPRTGRVHTSYHQAVVATGRLSSTDPNLQNIPVRSHEGRRIRQAFVADPGHVLMSADYSQIELRIMAHLSGDAGLLTAFREGGDVHRATAAEVFGVSPEAVSDEQRRQAKAINFGLIYGMSAFGLAAQLGIERSAAQKYMEVYFARYPGVRVYMDETRARAREHGYVETVFGRRLYTPDIRASNQARRQYAERTAINAPMQGTAADIIKRAMISVDGWIQSSGSDVRMIMQVHDELVFEVAAQAVDSVRGRITSFMEGAAQLNVPLIVDVGVGANWDEAH